MWDPLARMCGWIFGNNTLRGWPCGGTVPPEVFTDAAQKQLQDAFNQRRAVIQAEAEAAAPADKWCAQHASCECVLSVCARWRADDLDVEPGNGISRATGMELFDGGQQKEYGIDELGNVLDAGAFCTNIVLSSSVIV